MSEPTPTPEALALINKLRLLGVGRARWFDLSPEEGAVLIDRFAAAALRAAEAGAIERAAALYDDERMYPGVSRRIRALASSPAATSPSLDEQIKTALAEADALNKQLWKDVRPTNMDQPCGPIAAAASPWREIEAAARHAGWDAFRDTVKERMWKAKGEFHLKDAVEILNTHHWGNFGAIPSPPASEGRSCDDR